MQPLTKFRCKRCTKPLFFAAIAEGTVSIDCQNSKCRHRNVFKVTEGKIINEEEKETPGCRLHAECKIAGGPCRLQLVRK